MVIGTRANLGGDTMTASESVKHIGIPAKELEPCAQDGTVWHALTKRAFINGEPSRQESLVPEKKERPQLLLQIQIQFPSSVTCAPDV